jgi:hypothetical protein
VFLRRSRRLFWSSCAVALLTVIPVAPALADVNLSIVNPTAINGNGDFSFTVRLATTAGEQVKGVDYYLTSNGSGLFSIVDRNTAGSPSGSPFVDPLYYNDTIVESAPSSLLDPRNDHDLGGLATTATSGAGPFLLATFTLHANPSASGLYTFQTTSNPGEGWLDTTPQDHPFNNHGSIQILVPEPAGLTLLSLTATAAVCRRRRVCR